MRSRGRGCGATFVGVSDVFGQGDFAVRMEWGPTGASACRADVAVVVDVLSFSTAVTVAVERGTKVYPCPWGDVRGRALASELGAALAVGRRDTGLDTEREGEVPAPSLSPAALLEAEPIELLVLPSPNGSAIAAALADVGSVVVAGCLRNARAVAVWVGRQLAHGASVVVLAAGERWQTDGSLRPALTTSAQARSSLVC